MGNTALRLLTIELPSLTWHSVTVDLNFRQWSSLSVKQSLCLCQRQMIELISLESNEFLTISWDQRNTFKPVKTGSDFLLA